jgi:hypothetical protein
MYEYVHKAHKVAYAVGKRLSIDIVVRRLPMPKGRIAFEFVSEGKSAAFGQSFLDDNLAQFATRLMGIYAGATRGHTKGNARHKGERV